ncbi:hypothetical protein IFM89_017554 [Coptis chinensis]|uniref:Helicase MOV-10-like beta-barrel domain-containing protein n=1 Tax=Coptis chinensis TaxID=261450 RepID=A0A835HTA2_9MAGN|nr:hypothetical protein IFM89_017554 [Coptis chinensis]
MDFSLNREFLALTSNGGSTRVWKIDDGVPLTSRLATSDEKIECCRFLKGWEQAILFCTVQKGDKVRPFLLSRDFVLVHSSGKNGKPFQGILYRVVKSNLVLAEFGDDFHRHHSSTRKYDVSFSFNRVCLKRCHQAVTSATDPLFRNFLYPSQKSRISWASPSVVPSHRNLNKDQAVAVRDGHTAAESTLKLSKKQTCPDPSAFIEEVEKSFTFLGTKEGDVVHPAGCMHQLLEKVRRHKVNIDGNVCTVMVTMLVLEGWQQKLDPDYSVMKTLQTLLFKAR